MNFKSLALSTAFFLSIFGANAQLMNNISVSGSIENATPNSMVYLMELVGQGMQPIDSVMIKSDNTFFISANIKNANFFQLSLGGKEYTIIILEPNQNLHIDIDANSLMKPKNIKGSEDTKQVYSILENLNVFKAQEDVLDAEYQKVYGTAEQDSIGKILLDKFQQIEKQKTDYLIDEINKKPTMATMLFIDQLKIGENLDLYEKVDNILYNKYPENAFITDLHGKIAGKLRLAIGRPAPEINLASPEGANIKLSSLKGKIVLIDFWASWCGPCRRESPEMVKIYKEYHDKGFEIYSVSLDKERSSWLKAIEDDGLNWIHVSDLRYWSSVAAKEYGVGSIPFTVLLDKEGKIMATGLRGSDLEAKLAEIFDK